MTQTINLQAGAKAFGDGAHPSTLAMLTALDALRDIRGIGNVLDMGCGSGILALRAAWQWHARVLAVDIAAESVATTKANAAHNQLNDLVEVIQADGCSHPLIRSRAPYHLIMANMLSEPLIGMAHDFSALSEPQEGLILLSGILRWQADQVAQAYQILGFNLLQRYVVGDWVCLLMQRQEEA